MAHPLTASMSRGVVAALALAYAAAPSAVHAQAGACPGPASRDPAWFPDGTRIVFSSTSDGPSNIWSMAIATGTLERLTDVPENGFYPRVSPDGRRVAFAVMGPKGQHVAIVDATGGKPRAVTDPKDDAADPEWLPDGRLVYSAARGGGRDLWVSDADGGNASVLFQMNGEEWGPRISPSGDRLLFHNDGHGTYDVYTARLDGTDVRLVARSPGFDGVATWSPDGASIAYYTRAPASGDGAAQRPAWETAEIMVVQATGGVPRALTQNGVRDQSPAWSPDGRTIAWSSCVSGNLEVWLMDADGKNARQLTRTPLVR